MNKMAARLLASVGIIDVIEIQGDEPHEVFYEVPVSGKVRVGALALSLRDNGTMGDNAGKGPPWRWSVVEPLWPGHWTWVGISVVWVITCVIAVIYMLYNTN